MPNETKPAPEGGICTRIAPGFTEESRAKAKEARLAKIAEGAKYRRDFMDAEEWDQLAKSRGIRLPPWWAAPTRGKLNSWWKRLGDCPFADAYGCKPNRLIELNPAFPLRAFVGMMLERAK
jgi:hypothetical protein